MNDKQMAEITVNFKRLSLMLEGTLSHLEAVGRRLDRIGGKLDVMSAPKAEALPSPDLARVAAALDKAVADRKAEIDKGIFLPSSADAFGANPVKCREYT